MADQNPTPEDFKSLTRPPFATFGSQQLAPPSPLYVTVDDQIVAYTNSRQNGSAMLFRARVMETSGRITSVETRWTNQIGTELFGHPLTLIEGWILSATLEDATGTMEVGELYASLRIVRAYGVNNVTQQVLCSGYVTGSRPLSWPGSGLESTRDGKGYLRVVLGTNPAAGVQVQETVPSMAIWRLISMRVVYVTDATVANRNLNLTIDDGANVYFSLEHNTVATASATWLFTLAVGATDGYRSTFEMHNNLPDNLILPAGHRITINARNFTAGDDFAAPVMYVEEWLRR